MYYNNISWILAKIDTGKFGYNVSSSKDGTHSNNNNNTNVGRNSVSNKVCTRSVK